MGSLKGRFIRTNILMIIISAVLVLSVSILLLFIFSIKEQDGFLYLFENLKEAFYGNFEIENRLQLYILIWFALVITLILSTCILLSINLSRAVLLPLKDLQNVAENIIEGNLDFEILRSEVNEIDKLCHSFEEIRKELKQKNEKEKIIEEERNMLMANLSHDMRTPITTIKGYLEGIKDGVANSPEKVGRYLDTIYTKTLILEKMLDDITEYSELKLGRMQYDFKYIELTTYLNEWIKDIIIDIEEHNLKLQTDLIEKTLMIVADKNKLKRVLDNLISNAIKYNRGNGLILIKTEANNKGVLICISDTGCGIKEDNNRLFGVFYRGDASRSNIRGSGLGLAISKQIVERHRGKIWIKNNKGTGTDVFVYLPLREEEINENPIS